jgi:LytS/YehU family sensor histidine kinase
MDLFYDSFKNIAAIALIAYPLTKNASFRRSLIMNPNTEDKLILSLLFGGFSILGNLLGIETFNGALIDSRIVGPVVGGIVAGPVVGIAAGLLGGLHRLSMGGFTIVPDFIANIIGGIIGGVIYHKYGKKRMNFMIAFLAGGLAELVLKGLTLLLAKPAIVAKALVSMIGLTTTLVNALGVAIFVTFVQDVQSSQHLIGASYAEKALEIARQTLPILKKGFNEKTAGEIAQVIYNIAGVDAVAITDNKKILAFKGAASDHHIPGNPVLTSSTREAIKGENVLIANSKEEIGCPVTSCPLDAVIEAPLTCNGEFIGCLKVYKVGDIMHLPDIKMVTGIANLLSLQLENLKLDEQAKLLAKAEYATLRAQINPHFLFNALSVIKLLIRTDPKRAQDLIVSLAAFFRRTLKHNEDLLPFSEELEGVQIYLDLQKARFGERLQIDINVEESCGDVLFPTFALQPLVENSMNHGLSHKKGLLILKINAQVKNGYLVVSVLDNGIGIPEEVIQAVKTNSTKSNMGIGLTNINRRLKSLYGSNYTFRLENTMDGSLVLIKIPVSYN